MDIARVFSQTFARNMRGLSMDRSKAGIQDIISTDSLSVARAYRYPGVVTPISSGWINLHLQSMHYPLGARRGKCRSIGYRKCETHARVISRTLEHGNSNNEIRQRNRGRRWEELISGKKYSRHKIKSRRATAALAYIPSPLGHYSPKQSINYLAYT